MEFNVLFTMVNWFNQYKIFYIKKQGDQIIIYYFITIYNFSYFF